MQKKVYFSGIGGIGMSALACLMKDRGDSVSGSDLKNSALIDHLQSINIEVKIGQVEENISGDIDLLIHSLAVDANNPELKAAKSLGLEIQSYPEALGAFMKDFKSISICGTHGKSTTTAMLANIFLKAYLDPNVLLGTKLAELNGHNYRSSKGEYFIIESCEYMAGFLHLYPDIALITNLDPDHLDYYGTEEKYFATFARFLSNIQENGLLIYNYDDIDLQQIVEMNSEQLNQKNIQIVSFGSNLDAEYVLKDKDVYHQGKKIMTLGLLVPGKHNLMNALSAVSLCSSLGLDLEIVSSALNHFGGTWRRLELKGNMSSGAIVYDDYAHHPVEIKASLQAIRELYSEEKITVVFQPHQYSRTKFLLKEFGESFGDADQVIIPNIYKVRDTQEDIESVSAEDLVTEVKKHMPNVIYGDGFQKTAKFLEENTSSGEIVIIMGAGDIENLADILLKN